MRWNLGRTPHLVAFFCITALICGLLVTNYVTQHSLQQANINRFQQNFKKSTASISYFFSERENDILDLTSSKPVTDFFSNRNLGMSMTYGLRSSLNDIAQLFKRRTASARMGEKPIYSHLALLEANGKMLSRWPTNGMDEYQYLPEEASATTVTVVGQTFGCITFIGPVFLHDKLQGYILGEVNSDTLTDYLLGDAPGLLFITKHGQLVFQSQPETTILADALERFGRTDTVWPLKLNSNDFIEPPATSQAENTTFTLLFSAIPKYKINLYLAEKSSNISSRQSLFLFMVVLAVLSAGVLLVSGTMLRANTKNLVLETSLFEAGKREQAVAEKIEELKLIIDDAWVNSEELRNVEFCYRAKEDGAQVPMSFDISISPVRNEEGDIASYVAIKRDVTKMDLLQKQLLQAQKMVAIGQLAAGIAHEINTPMQYVQNNVTFFERAFKDISVLVGDYKKLQESPGIELSREAREHLKGIDLDFLMEEIPESLSETHGGINRVVQIVSAMKEFSHPGTDDKTATDLNRALENTITVSRNEWKYVAEMDTDFDPDLPMVPCLPGQLNQVILNLIINGAQAIEETGASVPNNPGRISISTRHDAKWVEIRVSDSGGGIPEEIYKGVFDPFFTTKEVGKGTGQGLSIIHEVVVQKHGGSIDFISDPDKGTTFILRLPIKTIENDEGKA